MIERRPPGPLPEGELRQSAARSGQLGKPPPRSPEQTPQGEGSRSPEREPLPGVWDVLERHVRLRAKDVKNRPRGDAWMREAIKEERLLTEIEDRGTDRDRLILEWFDYVTTPNGESKPDPFRLRLLSLEKFQQLRSKIDPLSDEQIGEEIEKQKEYLLRKEKTRLRARRYRQRLKEQDRSQTEQQQPTQLYPPPAKE